MKDELSRLRGRVNILNRRIQQLETSLDNEVRCRDRRIEALERELAGIKSSRVWRTAMRVRRFIRVPWKRTDAGQPDKGDRRAEQYALYLRDSDPEESRRHALRQRVEALPEKPLVSIVMPVHNVEPAVFELAVKSVLGQVYECWELCVVDDASDRRGLLEALERLDDSRINVQYLAERRNIAAATNAALEAARGEYVAFMDHDDELAPHALLEVVAAVNETGADFIYTDEDGIDAEGQRISPHFKPDFSPELLLSHNYVTHLVAVSRGLLRRVGGLRSEYDGAQDYDFVLRATEQAELIHHVPEILYHWRRGDTSTSTRADSKPLARERGRRAVADALARRGIGDAEVTDANVPHFYRVKYPIRGEPLVSILVPFKDEPRLLHCVIGDILEKSTYQNFEVIGISNNSTEKETFEAMEDLAALDKRVRFLVHDIPFNFPALINHGASSASGVHLVLLNNDIRLISRDWLESLLEYSQLDGIGAVGGKLYYPDNRVQHAGVIVGIGGYAGHSHKGFPARHQGYLNRLQVVQNVSAVTGAFMMVEKSQFEAVDGFDEQRFPVACNDVDFCLRLMERGLRNVFTPHSEAYHVESASRGYEDTPEKLERFAAERKRFADRHGWILEKGDPYYNPNLTRDAEDFSIRLAAG